MLTDYYDGWATTYEKDAHSLGYVGPRKIADLFAEARSRHLSATEEIVALDAGCGTGLVGPPLTERGVTILDGIDLSHEMVTEAAKTGAYRVLSSGVDLNLGLRETAAGIFDVTVSCGVFTTGHVRPAALDGLLRVTRTGGLVVFTTSQRYLERSSVVEHVEGLVAQGRTRVLERREDQPYLVDERAHYWVLQVL
ncbi:class I SAM-dependent DNA methyltransferase [Streptomyces longisporoflavus]|uniref:Class I SAM-dependent DNA methyltransferase n=1 Tax=Streptomyces longisporoflavus TaxID=28044 RepID=A0ABW7R5U6_9ACTN